MMVADRKPGRTPSVRRHFDANGELPPRSSPLDRIATCQGSTRAGCPRWTPWDGNQSRLSSSVNQTGTTPLAERLLTALPGMHLPAHVGAFAPKNASLPSRSRKMVANFYLPDAPPLRSFNHTGDEPAHRMLSPASAVDPSFVMSFIPSLTSLETVTSQAIDQRLPLPERELFPHAASARDFALRA